MKRILTVMAIALLATATAFAQRITDKLDRGLVAIPTSGGIFLSWRIPGEEYYDVTYNLYCDGTLVASDLNVSNYTHVGGTKTNQYQVAAVVRGKEMGKSKAVTAWASSYKDITPKHDPAIKSTLVPNDACCADVDGDGEVEILLKYDNADEMGQSYPRNGPAFDGVSSYEYSIFECLKLDGTVLWWVNCGPNMGDFQNNEQNIIGYDWNGDGKAEAVMRLEEGSSIHMADGSVYTIGADGKNGTSWTNYRGATGGGVNWFMHDGKEFLVYCDGETGKVNDIIAFPLARLEPGETSLEAAWGDGTGHRSSKFFFGAPYLDGKKPSIFLARGIYTQIKMCAYDVNPATNKLEKRWDWRQTNGGFWMWQGYHNFCVADVDWDGRDEIVYGSMVVNDNGKGLSTTGLGHGDAQHCGDFNPYIHGQEIYACNEDQPGNNYRDATTSKIYHRFESGNDDGRAMAGNFCNDYPGGQGCSAREGLISLVYNKAIPDMNLGGVNTNFRIYWDGDLLEETFNYLNGANSEGCVAKYGSWSPIYTCVGSKTNNDTKGTPCYQGDILGDWREEIIMRTANNHIRIYSTPTPTKWRNYTLWHDHQYRNAMVWQMCGYNQPPHVSYYLGEMEKITVAPPPLTMTDRTEVQNGGEIGIAQNDQHVIVCENGNSNITIAEGAKPYIVTFNVPTWVQGTASTNYIPKEAEIRYTTYTCNVTGGGITGDARIVKQGDGILNLPKANFTHTGETNIWAGTLNFDGTMHNSDVWLNRFAELNSNGGEFKSLKADYGSIIRPGGDNTIGSIKVDEELNLGFGSRLVIEIDGDAKTCDCIKTGTLKIERKTGEAWTKYGPEYYQPVLEIKSNNLTAGEYVIAEADSLSGLATNLKIEGVSTLKTGLKFENGKVILSLGDTRGASYVIWTGSTDSNWDFYSTPNFTLADDATAMPETFVKGDQVEFNDDAKVFTVNLNEPLFVSSLNVVNTKSYTLQGTGSITEGSLLKENKGTLTIKTINSYAGGNYLRGGTVSVSALSNDVEPEGNLGKVTTDVNKFTMENGAVLLATSAVKNGSSIKFIGEQGGVISNSSDFIQQGVFTGTVLTKKGTGTLRTDASGATLGRMIITAGTVQNNNGIAAKVVELQGGTLNDGPGTSNEINIPAKKSGTWNTSNRQNYSNKLTGEGAVSVVCGLEKGSTYVATRTQLQLNLASFAGTLTAKSSIATDGRFTFNTTNGGNKWTLDIPAGVIVQNNGKALTIGNLTGSGTLGGFCSFSQNATPAANTWTVGNDNDFKFEGIVTSNDKFIKAGTGKMTATGKWNTSGSVSVNAGQFQINSGAQLGTGTLTIAKGALFSGTTSSAVPLSNSSYTVNGTVMVGSTANSSTGTIDFGKKAVKFNAGSVLQVCVRKCANETNTGGTSISNISTLTMNGSVRVKLASTASFAAGDSVILWTATKTAGTPVLEEECRVIDAEKGLYWDDSRLNEGLLFVAYDPVITGVRGIAEDDASAPIYSINGVRQTTNNREALKPGTYIQKGKKFIIR